MSSGAKSDVRGGRGRNGRAARLLGADDEVDVERGRPRREAARRRRGASLPPTLTTNESSYVSQKSLSVRLALQVRTKTLSLLKHGLGFCGSSTQCNRCTRGRNLRHATHEGAQPPPSQRCSSQNSSDLDLHLVLYPGCHFVRLQALQRV
jgi:hypothetical protein